MSKLTFRGKNLVIVNAPDDFGFTGKEIKEKFGNEYFLKRFPRQKDRAVRDSEYINSLEDKKRYSYRWIQLTGHRNMPKRHMFFGKLTERLWYSDCISW